MRERRASDTPFIRQRSAKNRDEKRRREVTKTVLRGEKKKERDEIRDAIRRLRDRHRGGLPRRCHSGRRHIELN